MARIGYARVSTRDQFLDGQLGALSGCYRIYSEKASGAKRDRRELEKALAALKEGDVLVVTRLDRLARSTRDLLEIVRIVKDAGAGLQSLSEPWADTTSPAGTLMMTILAGLAEFERALIIERTTEGRKRAMEAGVRFGRPPKLRPIQRKAAVQMVGEGKSYGEVARAMGVHRTTILRASREAGL